MDLLENFSLLIEKNTVSDYEKYIHKIKRTRSILVKLDAQTSQSLKQFTTPITANNHSTPSY